MGSAKERYTKWMRLWLLGFGANRYKNVKKGNSQMQSLVLG